MPYSIRSIHAVLAIVAAALGLSAAATAAPGKDLDNRPPSSPAVPSARLGEKLDLSSVSSIKARLKDARSKSVAERDEDSTDRRSTKATDTDEDDADYLGGYLTWLEMRAYPRDSIDPVTYDTARRHRDTMPAAHLGGGAYSAHVIGGSGNWQFVGPANFGGTVNSIGSGPLGGRVNAVAWDPTTAGTYYAGAASGGLWKTTNSGSTWTPLGDKWPDISVSALAVDPTNHSIVYAGTGDFDGFKLTSGIGIMKSTDGGTTWTQLGATQFAHEPISKIIIDPTNHLIITVTSGRGAVNTNRIYRSTDGGTTWTATNAPSLIWSDMALSIPNAGVYRYYASGWDPVTSGAQLWTSTNQGSTWTKLTWPVAAPDGDNNNDPRVAPSRTSTTGVYVIDPANHTVWKSTNTGSSWTVIGDVNTLAGDYAWAQASWDSRLSVSTVTDGTGTHDSPYVQLIDMFQAPDGVTWQSIASYGAPTGTHADEHAIDFKPGSPQEALVGNDGGVWDMIYNSTTGATTWASLNRTLGIAQFWDSDISQDDPNVIVGGTQDDASAYTVGDTSNWGLIAAGDGTGCAINPTNSLDQYASYQYQALLHTTDGWQTLTSIAPDFGTDGIPFIGHVALDPSHPNLLYVGTNYLWRYDSSTQTWTARLGNMNFTDGIGVIAVAPSDSNRIYVAVDQTVWISGDQGATWRQITGSATPNLWCTSISVNPTNANDVIIGFSGTGSPHLWRTTNANVTTPTWTNISGTGSTGLPDISLNAVARDLADPVNTLYAATDVGVFYSTNGGSAWSNATSPLGLPNVQVNQLKAIAGTGYLYAGTWGRGMWRIPLRVAPAIPTGVTATKVGAQVQISWAAVSGATSYKVFRSTVSGYELSPIKTGNTTTSYTDSGVTASYTYYYKVSAVNANGNSAKSAEVSIVPNLPPPAPTGLFTQSGTSQVVLTWTAAPGATSYSVYRGTTAGGESTTAVATGIAGTTFTNTGLTNGTTYFFKIAAVNASGTSPKSSEVSGRPIAAPTGVAATPGDSQVTVSWNAVSGVLGYNLYMGTTPGGEAIVNQRFNITTTNYTVFGSNGTTYYFKVTAVNTGAESAKSAEVSATPNVAVPSTPTGVTATAGNAQVTLAWTASTGATSYNLYRSTTAGGEGTTAIVTGISGSPYINTGLTNSTKYYYKLAAVNSAGISTQSSEVSATPSSGGGGAPVIAIACGNTAQGSYVADTDFSGGSASSGTTTAIDTSAVTNPAPMSVYQHARKGTCTYTIPGLTAGASYTVRLHFAEYAATAAGQRTFNVAINGTQVLTSFDIFAAAGGEFKATTRSFTATADAAGHVTIVFTTVVNNVLINGIEVTTAGSGPGTFVDNLNDFTKVSTKTANWGLDTTTPTNFNADASRAIRTVDDSENLTYAIPNITGFSIVVYTKTATISQVNILTSTNNGTSYAAAAINTGTRTVTANGWGYYTLTNPAALSEVTNLQVQILPGSGTGGDPELGKVSITHN